MKITVIQCGENQWMFKIFGGKIHGKVVRKQQKGFSTKKEANDAANQLYDQLLAEAATPAEPETTVCNEDSGTEERVKADALTLNQAYTEFIEREALDSRSYATIERYHSVYKNHFRKELGEALVSSMTSESIQNFLDYKNESYSNEFVKGIYNLFSVIFKYLMEKQYLCCNPMDHVSPPISYRKAEFEVYSPELLNALLERLRSTAMIPPVMIGIHLGVRTGECYALRWSDFDLDSCTVTISKQLQYQNGSWSFVPPKYEFCHRTLTFTGSFKQYLIELKKMQELLRANSPTQILPEIIVDRIGKKEGYAYVDDFVCLKPDGWALNANSSHIQDYFD